MNKYQEALNELASYYDYDDYPKILQELVDKATPFKPLNQEIEGINGVHYGQCKCGCEVWENYKFCTDCGQALYWSTDE